jgi:hypothetical protein
VQVALEPNESSRIKETKPSLALEKYTGKYSNGLHAPVQVKHVDGKLTLKILGQPFELEHWHYDTFRGKSTAGRPMAMLFTFGLNGEGRADMLRIPTGVGEDLRMMRSQN